MANFKEIEIELISGRKYKTIWIIQKNIIKESISKIREEFENDNRAKLTALVLESIFSQMEELENEAQL